MVVSPARHMIDLGIVDRQDIAAVRGYNVAGWPQIVPLAINFVLALRIGGASLRYNRRSEDQKTSMGPKGSQTQYQTLGLFLRGLSVGGGRVVVCEATRLRCKISENPRLPRENLGSQQSLGSSSTLR